MSLDLVPKGTRKYQGQASSNDTARQRTVNHMLNDKRFKLFHLLGETVVMNKCLSNVTSKFKLITPSVSGISGVPRGYCTPSQVLHILYTVCGSH